VRVGRNVDFVSSDDDDADDYDADDDIKDCDWEPF
jgi:hypothetical protein